MKAEPLLIRKRVYPNGDIVEIKAWIVGRSKDKPHGFKYSLVFIRDGKRVIGYDNAESKKIIGTIKAGSISTLSEVLTSL
jgi:hypothetical protein